MGGLRTCEALSKGQNAASRKLVDEYFDALMVELKQKAKTPWAQSGLFHAVYIGGGTPTDLSPQQVEQLGKAIRQYFSLANDVEMTLEGRINRFGDEMFDRALEGGFNRFSFGIQSFNTQVRRSAKRLAPSHYAHYPNLHEFSQYVSEYPLWHSPSERPNF